MTLTKEKIISRPCEGKNSYFIVSDENTDDVSINNNLLTIESVKEIFKEMFEEEQNASVIFVSRNTAPL